MQGEPQYGQPGQPSYQGQPANYGQPAPTKSLDYSAPRAMAPGVLMIVASALNLGFLIYLLSIPHYNSVLLWADMIGAIVFYFIVGTLGIISAQTHRSKGPAIALIVLATLTLFTCLNQMGYNMSRIIILHPMYEEPYTAENWIAYSQIILVLVAFISFCVCIALIAIASKAVCTCCGAPPAQQSGVVYYQTATAPTYQTTAQTK
ncbi:uncharacterized protein LOC135486467 [Lineus longissimus]|uniref:uncharacterized protein LOC135486467 n=1 Tax=Lineus longissimus TaxID=88925 RepID=UPI002B4F8C3A